MAKPSLKTIVIGGEPAALSAALRLAERGARVKLFSSGLIGRSGDSYADEGINAAADAWKEGDCPELHFEETIRNGGFLANQELPRRMCDAGPGILNALDRMGVAFDRTPEGRVAFKNPYGDGFRRTAFAGTATAYRIRSALNGQVRAFEERGLIERFEGWEFVSPVLDGRGICRGIVAQNLATSSFEPFKADAVIACAAGSTEAFGRFSASAGGEACVSGALYRQGAYYANGEFVRTHPTALFCADRLRPLSWQDCLQGRFFVPRNGNPWYFLEEWFPKIGTSFSPDIVNRALHKVVYELNLGVEGRPLVHLDFSHLDRKIFEGALSGLTNLGLKFAGTDPRRSPLTVTPCVTAALGGLWTDDDHMTNIPGTFAAGGCSAHYHGANILPGNALLASTFGGFAAAGKMLDYCAGLARGCDETDEGHFINECSRQREKFQGLIDMSGPENLHRLHEELGETMIESMSSVRSNAKLASALDRVREFKERFDRGGVSDKGQTLNREAVFARRLNHALDLAHVMILGALLRDESRGGHYKPDFPERDDEKYLKTTKARWGKEEPLISYEDVDTRYLKPKPLPYGREKKAS